MILLIRLKMHEKYKHMHLFPVSAPLFSYFVSDMEGYVTPAFFFFLSFFSLSDSKITHNLLTQFNTNFQETLTMGQGTFH